jgi:diamine N-acetyltransferase
MPPTATVELREIGPDNWRDCAALQIHPAQRDFVMPVSYYLALCCYGGAGWSPLAVHAGGAVVGFLMWAIDPADGSCWFGGVTIAAGRQRQGYGSAALRAAMTLLGRRHGCEAFALSYAPANRVAEAAYRRLGFEETGEMEGDEVVARRRDPAAAGTAGST